MGEVIHQVKLPIAKPDDLSSVPGMHTVKGRTASPASFPLTSTCTVLLVCAHTLYTQMNGEKGRDGRIFFKYAICPYINC